MNYDEMPAGPEMDRLVAERLMGWTNLHTRDGSSGPIWFGTDPSGRVDVIAWPSTNIAHAWEVVEKLRELLRPKQWGLEVVAWNDGGWQVRIGRHNGGGDIGAEMTAEADTAPLAICRAALKAVASSRPNGGEGTAPVPG